MTHTIKLPDTVNCIVADFVAKIISIEPKFVEGVYLTGSIPLNDFYFNKSDIDFVVICKKLPDDQLLSQLIDIHKVIEKRYPKPIFNGSYLGPDAIISDSPHNIKILSYHEGKIRYGNFEMAAISLLELKFNSITIYGQRSETLPVQITTRYVIDFLHRNINSYWKNWIKRHSLQPIRKCLLLLLPRLTEWSVLGVARQFYTLKTGKIASKTEAGLYCLEHLPEKFHPIIWEAIEIRKNNSTYLFVKSYAIKPSRRRFTQTIDCVNYMIATFNKTYGERQ